MNELERRFSQANNLAEFAGAYLQYLNKVLGGIDVHAIGRMGDEFERARKAGATIFVVGNGGSATTASSMANDLGFDIVKKARPDRTFRVLALTDNNGAITAIANDVGYKEVFVGQLKIHYRAGDKLVVISASGNSPNAVAAAEFVRSQGGTVIALLGFDGGVLKDIADVVVLVPTQRGDYGPVEDGHLIINHILAHWFQNALKAGSSGA